MVAPARFAPSSLRFRLELDPQPGELVAGFERWADSVTSWRRPMEYVADAIRSHHAYHLDSEGASTGQRFAALSERYRRAKERAYPGRPILTRTGAMLAALADKRSASHLSIVTDDGVAVGPDPSAVIRRKGRSVRLRTYMLAHQYGTATMPKRPPVRADLSATPGSLGESVRQILQIEVVAARREAFGKPLADPDARMRRIAMRRTR